MRVENKLVWFFLAAALFTVLALCLLTVESLYVLLPGFACALLFSWLFVLIWERDRQIPSFDIGVCCALVTFLYSAYPLINYYANGFQFDNTCDARLASYQITPEELGMFHLRHVLYLFSFVTAYAVFRKPGFLKTGNICLPDVSQQYFLVLLFLALNVYFIALQWLTGINYSVSYDRETYGNMVVTFKNTSLPVLQISNKLNALYAITKIALLSLVVRRCKSNLWFSLLCLWLLAEILFGVFNKGARTSVLLFVFSTILFYNRMVKPFNVVKLALAIVICLGLFNFMGMYRGYYNYDDLQADVSSAKGGVFSGNNEFQSILGTGYDVFQRTKDATSLPWYLYINDIINILPPQQFLWFEKVSAAEWYLREIGLSGTGAGCMWGVISQSTVGFGCVELAIRGVLLGLILAKCHAWYVRRQTGFLESIVYAYLILRVYYTFRDTTLSLLTDIVQVIIPFVILFRLGRTLFPKPRSHAEPASKSAAPPHS